MTLEELKKIPFHFESYLSMTHKYQTTYVDDSGRLAICDITERINEITTGKKTREYRIDGNRYISPDTFVKALEKIPAWTLIKKEGEE